VQQRAWEMEMTAMGVCGATVAKRRGPVRNLWAGEAQFRPVRAVPGGRSGGDEWAENLSVSTSEGFVTKLKMRGINKHRVRARGERTKRMEIVRQVARGKKDPDRRDTICTFHWVGARRA